MRKTRSHKAGAVLTALCTLWTTLHAGRAQAAPDTTAPRVLHAVVQKGLIGQNVDEADAIVARTVKLPPGVFKEAIASKRWVFDVQPAWGKERKIIWDMFERAVAAKYLDKLPDDGIIYSP